MLTALVILGVGILCLFGAVWAWVTWLGESYEEAVRRQEDWEGL